jgi:hypothetical protein
MIKTFEQFNIDILCEDKEQWWNNDIYTTIITYDNEIKYIYNTVSLISLTSYINEFVKYISILTNADVEELKKNDTNKRIIKEYTFKNPKIDMGWKTCSIFLIRGGDPFDTFKEYINTLKKQVNDLKAAEKNNKLK